MVIPSTLHSFKTEWETVKASLPNILGDNAYNSWLTSLDLSDITDSGLPILSAKSRFITDYINKNYKDNILDVWKNVNDNVLDISIKQTSNKALNSNTKVDALNSVNKITNTNIQTQELPKVRRIDGVNSNNTFENFVPSISNELALASVKRVIFSQEAVFNPLFIHSKIGNGKTHLLQATANQIVQNDPSKKVIYLSAEKFMYSFVKSVKNQTSIEFKENLRSADVLIIEDLQFITGKATQTELLHTIKALSEKGKQVIISSNVSPFKMESLQNDFVKTVSSGLVIDMCCADKELKEEVIKQKAEKIGLELTYDVIEFLSSKSNISLKELEGAVKRIYMYSSLSGNDIDIIFVNNLLKDMFVSNEKVVSVDHIKKCVARKYGLTLKDIDSSRKERKLARPRQIAMYLSKQLTSKSLPDIGNLFGGRDHTTVIYAVNKINGLINNDSLLAKEVNLLENLCKED